MTKGEATKEQKKSRLLRTSQDFKHNTMEKQEIFT
jgi:hypothetical protein